MSVHQLIGILSDGFGYFRMTMPQRRHIDSAGKIDEFIAVGIFQNAAVSALKRHRKQPHLFRQSFDVLNRAAVQCFAFRTRNLSCHDFRIGF